MRVLVTGSSGWLGRTLMPLLESAGHVAVGLDPLPAPTTRVVGSVVDRGLVRRVLREHAIDAVVHAGALHKPHVATHDASEFLAVNVEGTLNLLEEATAPGAAVKCLVFTSTTSLMISQEIWSGAERGERRAAWIDEEMAPLLPRNIYGVSKLSAEHLCRLYHETCGLPVVVLRTARFFPEEDDQAHKIVQSGENTKANEFLYRRLTVADAAEAHLVALARAPALGFDTFIISALTPFHPEDCEELVHDAPSVVAHYHPRYREIYARRGWTMFGSIDRVYDASKAMRRLGFACRTGFREVLEQLDRPGAATSAPFLQRPQPGGSERRPADG